MATQSSFLECYRGRQSALHHLAYMRMSKVLLALEILQRVGFTLEEKRVFDYGFGAGTFFRHCPRSSQLFGVELDPQAVQEVTASLRSRGYHRVKLEPIELGAAFQHPFLDATYDLVLCSHVLEHVPDPAEFLARLGRCLERSGGMFLGLVPINERKPDPHHVQEMTEDNVREAAAAAGLKLICWIEADPWVYWLQPIFTHETGWAHVCAQGISLSLGLLAATLGRKRFFQVARYYARISRSRATQAGFVLRRA